MIFCSIAKGVFNKLMIPLAFSFLYLVFESINDVDLSSFDGEVIFGLFVIIFILSSVSYFFRIMRWNCILNQGGYLENVGFFKSSLIYLSAFSFTIVPGKVGEMIRSSFLIKYNVPIPFTIGAFISERLYDLMAAMFLSLIYLHFFYDFDVRFSAFIALSLLLLVRYFTYSFLHALFVSDFFEKILNLNRTTNLKDGLVTSWGGSKFYKYFTFSLFTWSIQGLSLYFSLFYLGEDMSVFIAISIYCIGLIAGAISFIPGGLVVTEVSVYFLLINEAISPDIALIASVSARGATLIISMIIGFSCLCFLKFKQ